MQARLSTSTSNAEFSWRAHPARERRGGAALALAIIASVAVAAWLSFGPGWSIAAGIVLILALNRFFFPSRFVIDHEGITATYLLRTQRFRWADLRRFVHDERGGYLSRRAKRSGLDAYSGMHILFGEHRNSVIATIQEHMCDKAEGGQTCPS